jgi:hypothetical protein
VRADRRDLGDRHFQNSIFRLYIEFSQLVGVRRWRWNRERSGKLFEPPRTKILTCLNFRGRSSGSQRK